MWCYISTLLQLWLIVNAQNISDPRRYTFVQGSLSKVVERSANNILNTTIKLLNKYSNNLRRDASILSDKTQVTIDGFIFSVQDILNGRVEQGVRGLVNAAVKTIDTGETLVRLGAREGINIAGDAVNIANRIHPARLANRRSIDTDNLDASIEDLDNYQREKRSPDNKFLTPEQEANVKKVFNDTINTGWKMVLDSVLPSVDNYYRKNEEEETTTHFDSRWDNRMSINSQQQKQNNDGLSHALSFLDSFNNYNREKLEVAHKKETLPNPNIQTRRQTEEQDSYATRLQNSNPYYFRTTNVNYNKQDTTEPTIRRFDTQYAPDAINYKAQQTPEKIYQEYPQNIRASSTVIRQIERSQDNYEPINQFQPTEFNQNFDTRRNLNARFEDGTSNVEQPVGIVRYFRVYITPKVDERGGPDNKPERMSNDNRYYNQNVEKKEDFGQMAQRFVDDVGKNFQSWMENAQKKRQEQENAYYFKDRENVVV